MKLPTHVGEMRIVPEGDECYRHLDAECDICPYYEYVIEWEHGIEKGRFWVGQEVVMSWGSFGDSLVLTPRNQGMRLN